MLGRNAAERWHVFDGGGGRAKDANRAIDASNICEASALGIRQQQKVVPLPTESPSSDPYV